MKKLFLSLLAALLAPPALGASLNEVRGFKIVIHRQMSFSGVEGYAQIPMGGRPDSTSPGRPTFDEVDIGDIDVRAGGITARRGRHDFTVLGSFISRRRVSVLSTDFINHRERYYAGETVHTILKSDCYMFRHLYHVPLRKLLGAPLDASVGPCLLLWDFEFRVISRGGKVGVGGREFMQSNLHLYASTSVGLGRLTLTVNAVLPSPVQVHNFSSLWLEAASEYVLIDRGLMTCHLILSLSYTRFRFKDQQGTPNDILIELSPILNVGFRIRL